MILFEGNKMNDSDLDLLEIVRTELRKELTFLPEKTEVWDMGKNKYQMTERQYEKVSDRISKKEKSRLLREKRKIKERRYYEGEDG